VNDSLPPFPSGEALERVAPGSSTVTLRTSYCDEAMRISRYDNDPNAASNVLVWCRKGFADSEVF
jgi:hypothetical protein